MANVNPSTDLDNSTKSENAGSKLTQSQLEVNETLPILPLLPTQLKAYLLALASTKEMQDWGKDKVMCHTRIYVLVTKNHGDLLSASVKSSQEIPKVL